MPIIYRTILHSEELNKVSNITYNQRLDDFIIATCNISRNYFTIYKCTVAYGCVFTCFNLIIYVKTHSNTTKLFYLLVRHLDNLYYNKKYTASIENTFNCQNWGVCSIMSSFFPVSTFYDLQLLCV